MFHLKLWTAKCSKYSFNCLDSNYSFLQLKESNTYGFQFSLREDEVEREPVWDEEHDEEGEGQSRRSWLHDPQDAKTHGLEERVQVHLLRLDLEK